MTQPTTHDGKRTWTRAEIEAMTQQQLEANADELLAAATEGRIDVTPAAREVPDGTVPHPSGKPWVKQSDLDRMTHDQLVANLDEITAATHEGRVLHHL